MGSSCMLSWLVCLEILFVYRLKCSPKSLGLPRLDNRDMVDLLE